MSRKRKRETEELGVESADGYEMPGLHETAMNLGGSEYESRISSSTKSIASDVVDGGTKLDVLKRRWLIDHRPNNDLTYCCDYHSGKALTESRSDGYLCR